MNKVFVIVFNFIDPKLGKDAIAAHSKSFTKAELSNTVVTYNYTVIILVITNTTDKKIMHR